MLRCGDCGRREFNWYNEKCGMLSCDYCGQLLKIGTQQLRKAVEYLKRWRTAINYKVSLKCKPGETKRFVKLMRDSSQFIENTIKIAQKKIKEENSNSAVIALGDVRKMIEDAYDPMSALDIDELMDDMETIAQKPCPVGEHNNERNEICPLCTSKVYPSRWYCLECKKKFEYGQYENPGKLSPVS